MSLFQNIYVFMAFYLSIMAFPFAVAAIHVVLDAADTLRSLGKRSAPAPVAVPV